MDIIAKNKALLWTVILLATLNIITITTFWVTYFNKPKPFPPQMFARQGPERIRESAENFMDKELNLTKEQSEKFKQKQDEHFRQVGDLFTQIHETRKSIMDKALSSNEGKADIEKQLAEIGDDFVKIEKLNYDHFGELKSLLNPEQQKKMKDMFNNMEPMMGPPPMRGPGMMPPPPPGEGGMMPPRQCPSDMQRPPRDEQMMQASPKPGQPDKQQLPKAGKNGTKLEK